MAKVSVVIPVYNVERYIKDCLDSMVCQTLDEIEVVLVDDKGQDKSIEICQEYAQKDKRIKIVAHSENKGLRCAVLTGVEASVGEYVMFVDSDDYVLPDYVETLYNVMIKQKVDCVSSGFVEKIGELTTHSFLKSTRRYSKQEIDQEILTQYFEKTENFHDEFGNSRVGKIYRTDILKKAFLGADLSVSMGEDLELNLRFLLLCDSIFTISDYAGYFYRIDRDNSMTNLYTMKRFLAHEHTSGEIKKLAKQYARPGKALGACNPYRHLYNFLNANTEYQEKMRCVKTILETISHDVMIENSIQEIFIYLSSNISLQDKLAFCDTVVERVENTDIITPKQKDDLYTSFMFHYINSDIPNRQKIIEIKKLKQLLSDKKCLLELSKTQPIMGKISYTLIYLGMINPLVFISGLKK